MKLRIKALVLLLSICFCLTALVSSAEVVIPDKPLNHVVDLAGIINDNVEANLNKYLLELEQKTTAQMVVLTINSLEGESLEDLSIKIAHEKWKLGQKDKDTGILLLISLQDRKYRFEIGYGLEGILPDSLVGSIGRDYLVPYFRKGDYSTGIFAATLAVISEIIKHPRLLLFFLMFSMMGGGRRGGWGGSGGFGGGGGGGFGGGGASGGW
jgi:uncharacterized protein